MLIALPHAGLPSKPNPASALFKPDYRQKRCEFTVQPRRTHASSRMFRDLQAKFIPAIAAIHEPPRMMRMGFNRHPDSMDMIL